MHRGVYINNHDIGEFGAKLQMDYAITGCDVTNATNQGPNRSSVLLLRQSFAPLHITLPLDFYGSGKQQTMARLSAFSALLTGKFEVDLGDGYQYTCILDEIGPTAWICDDICSVDVALSGLRHTAPMTIIGTSPLTLYNPGTWPQTACKITIGSMIGETQKVKIAHSNDDISYTFDSPIAGRLVLDGINMENRLWGKPIKAGTMEWVDYPWLAPGENTISAGELSKTGTIRVDFTPTYL